MKCSGPSTKYLIPIFTLLPSALCQSQQEQQVIHNSYQKIFTIIIIIGGYVALLIGAVIFRLEARQYKVIQFEEVGARGSSTTQHKFEELQQEIQNSAVKKQQNVEYESAGSDSTKRKRRKRKADRLSDRRKNNESNQSNQNNEECED